MTSINSASPLFNDNELNKILHELKVKVKEEKAETTSSVGNHPPRSPQATTPPSEGKKEDTRSVEDILRENFKID
jgi:hypothetical protein